MLPRARELRQDVAGLPDDTRVLNRYGAARRPAGRECHPVAGGAVIPAYRVIRTSVHTVFEAQP